MTTTETKAAPAETPAPEYELRVADRCDAGRCGAQAYVVTEHDAGPLFWCGHHFQAHPGLVPLVVVDNRDHLTKRETGDHA